MMTAEQKQKCFGCDIESYVESVKESITYRVSGIHMVMMSELSDVQEMIEHGMKEAARQKLNCVKHLLSAEVEKDMEA